MPNPSEMGCCSNIFVDIFMFVKMLILSTKFLLSEAFSSIRPLEGTVGFFFFPPYGYVVGLGNNPLDLSKEFSVIWLSTEITKEKSNLSNTDGRKNTRH